MNTQFILSNLKEAQEELAQAIANFEAGKEVSFGDFHVSMAHAYHHLNTAWNGRYATLEEWQQCTEENYAKWESFPKDLPLIGSDNFYDLPEYKKEDEEKA
jgi:hypothetical protein